MAAPATIPVEVAPEAATRIEELGMSKEFIRPEVRRYFSFTMRFQETMKGRCSATFP